MENCIISDSKQASRSFGYFFTRLVAAALISQLNRSNNFARNPNLWQTDSYAAKRYFNYADNWSIIGKKTSTLNLSLSDNIVSSAGPSSNWFFLTLFKTYFRTFILIVIAFQFSFFFKCIKFGSLTFNKSKWGFQQENCWIQWNIALLKRQAGFLKL